MSEQPDFVLLWNRYQALSTGDKAALKRVTEPDELREFHALYKLFPNERAHEGWLRAAFLLPWCDDCGDERRASWPSVANLLAEGGINEMRLFQVARAKSPNDIVQFRRLMIQLKHPKLNWQELGALLFSSERRPSEPINSWFWSSQTKRKLIEKYYLAQFTTAKGAR